MDDQSILAAIAQNLDDRVWTDPAGRLEYIADLLAQRRTQPDTVDARVDAIRDSDLGILAYDIADLMDRTDFALDLSQDAIEQALLPFLAAALRAQDALDAAREGIDDGDDLPPEGGDTT